MGNIYPKCKGFFNDMQKKFSAAGRRIAELRGSLTQAQFAERLGVDRKTVVNWEAGERLPDGASLLRLVEVFAADVNYILTGKRSHQEVLSSRERILLDNYRHTHPRQQKFIEEAAFIVSEPQPGRAVA